MGHHIPSCNYSLCCNCYHCPSKRVGEKIMSAAATVEKAKRLMNRKIILGGTALLIALVTICVSSFVPYMFKPENLRTYKFITDLIINCAIVVLAMVATIFIGQASNAQNPKSNVAKATAKFIASKKEVEQKGIHNFKVWVKKVQQPEDIRLIKNEILFSNGIEDPSILELAIDDVKALVSGPKRFNGIAYPGITEEQVKVIVKLKTKGIQIKLVPPEYYINVKNLTDARTKSQRAANEGAKKSAKLIVSVTSKLVLTIVFSSIFAMLAKDLSQNVDKLEAFSTLFFRLLNFFTSVFMGYLVGCQINDLDAEYIDMREEVHREFLEDKTFKAEGVKIEAERQIREEEEKNQKESLPSAKLLPQVTLDK